MPDVYLDGLEPLQLQFILLKGQSELKICLNAECIQDKAVFFNAPRGLKTIWDRCYDFLNIFGEKFSENIGIFCSNYC
jgi:hypothetical protein